MPAKSLRVGDKLQTLSGSTVRIDDIRVERGNFLVFNFEVEENHSYYAEGVLVHNCNGFIRGAGKTIVGNGIGAAARGIERLSAEKVLPKQAGGAATQGIADTARCEGFSKVQFPRGAVAATGATPKGYVRVSRWVGREEAKIWAEGGATRIPPEISNAGRIHVTNFGAEGFQNGDPIRIDFELPE